MLPYSVYIHIPFCVHRCAYCDFNTYAGLDNLIEPYVHALNQEIRMVGQSALQTNHEPIPVHTVFFGGGTPSLLSIPQLNSILQSLRQNLNLLPGAEITLEANPGTVSEPYIHALVQAGVTRLSLGMQSANPSELKLLERQHSLEQVIQTVAWAREAGLVNFNLDLIFGLPDQTLQSWKNSLNMALSLQPPHLALYALTLEHGTPMAHWVDRGLLSEPDNNLAAEMYEFTMDHLSEHGYAQYEISNWAKSLPTLADHSSRHNLQYWRGLPWLGLGAGAHGYIPGSANLPGMRTVNQLSPAAYIRRLNAWGSSDSFPKTPATADVRLLTPQDEQAEFMMMVLRLTEEGISDHTFTARFGHSLRQVYGSQIEKLINRRLVEWSPQNQLRLTRAGRLLGNQVFIEFI